MANDGVAAPRILIVMGVAGVGKSTVGAALAAALGWTFLDADDFHSAANREKLGRGEPLTDADRAPWLDALREALGAALGRDERVVLACSALRRSYRAALHPEGARPDILRFLWLRAPEPVVAERLARRGPHLAAPTILESQLRTLEPPRDALVLDATRPVHELVAAVSTALRTDAAR